MYKYDGNNKVSPRVFGESAVLITAKKCQTLDEYSEKTARGAMWCDFKSLDAYISFPYSY